MIKYDYTYTINDNISAGEICETAISKRNDGSLVMLIIDGEEIEINNLIFEENITIVVSETSDKIIFKDCTFKYLTGLMENNGNRVIFYGCCFEGEEVLLRSTGYEIFYNCLFKCYGQETSIISSFRSDSRINKLNYTVIIDSEMHMENPKSYVFINEGDASVTAINLKINKENGNVVWTKDMVNENTFSYYNCPGISGIDECGYGIEEQHLKMYSISNLISGEDEWKPESLNVPDNNIEKGVFFIDINKNISFTAGEEDTEIVLSFFPQNVKPVYTLKISGRLKIEEKKCDEGRIIFGISGENDSEVSEYCFVSFETKEGVKAECVAEVKPSLIEPPKFLSTPEIVIKDGRAVINYELDLCCREDLSEISWYRVDNIDRTKLIALREFVRSNEKDCRKIAISRNKPCREISLTPYDIGRHLKVNIKPKHIRSNTGPGLNVMSRIVMQSDVKSDNIVINIENQVLNPYYKVESGYGTATGIWLYKRLPMCRHYDMVTETNDCGYYFGSDIERENMTVYIILDFENNNGEGFGSRGEYQEIYIKYDAETRSGYGIRYECIDVENHIAGIALYKYDGLLAQPISEKITGSFLKSGMDIKADIYKNVFTMQLLIQEMDEPLELSAKIDGNLYSGMGIKHQAVSIDNNRIGIRHIEMSFPE